MDPPEEKKVNKGSIEYILNPKWPKFVVLNIVYEREPYLNRKETASVNTKSKSSKEFRCDECKHVYNRKGNYIRVSQNVIFFCKLR